MVVYQTRSLYLKTSYQSTFPILVGRFPLKIESIDKRMKAPPRNIPRNVGDCFCLKTINQQ